MTDSHASDDAVPLTCTEVLERIYEFLDGELTPQVEERIHTHLVGCKRCYPEFEHERVFLRFLEKRAQIEKAPPSLRKRIFRALVDEETARHDS
jgi:mycothiol system anti-sigma-R factor